MRSTAKLCVLFIVIYLIGAADFTSVSLGGGNIRLAWALLPVFLLFIPRGAEPRALLIFTALLFSSHVLSSIAAGTAVKGVAYSSWIIVNYCFFTRPAYLLTRQLGSRIWQAILWSGRIQIVCGVLLFAVGLHERTRFSYFEPSYLAIGLVPYIFAAIFISKRKVLDISLIIAVTVTSQSANLLITLSVMVFCWFIKYRHKANTLLAMLAIFVAGYIGFVSALNNPSNPNHYLASFIANNEIDSEVFSALLSRAGNRGPRIQAALQIIDNDWMWGLGPGNYIGISSSIDFSEIAGDDEYLDPAGMPVINVLLEAIANAGVLSAAVLLAVFAYIAVGLRHMQDTNERWAMLGAMISFAIMLQFESSYLRAYLWMAFAVFAARVRTAKLSRKAEALVTPELPLTTKSLVAGT